MTITEYISELRELLGTYGDVRVMEENHLVPDLLLNAPKPRVKRCSDDSYVVLVVA